MSCHIARLPLSRLRFLHWGRRHLDVRIYCGVLPDSSLVLESSLVVLRCDSSISCMDSQQFRMDGQRPAESATTALPTSICQGRARHFTFSASFPQPIKHLHRPDRYVSACQQVTISDDNLQHVYIHTCIHAYILTSFHTSILTYLHT